jgi:hypothetical protein
MANHMYGNEVMSLYTVPDAKSIALHVATNINCISCSVKEGSWCMMKSTGSEMVNLIYYYNKLF